MLGSDNVFPRSATFLVTCENTTCNTTLLPGLVDTIAPAIFRAVLDLIGVDKLCISLVYIKHDNNTFSVYDRAIILYLAWVAESETHLVPNKIKNLFISNGAIINFEFSNTLFDVRLKLLNRFDFPSFREMNKIAFNGEEFILKYRGKFDLHWCPSNIKMRKLLVCDRVVLQHFEFTVSYNDIILKSGVSFKLPNDYIIIDGNLSICAEDYLLHSAVRQTMDESFTSVIGKINIVLSFACSVISIVCLSITILTYIVFKKLRSRPGKINLCLCFSLLVAQVLQQFTIDLTIFTTACKIFGILIHFTWISTLLWMNTASFNLFLIFGVRDTFKRLENYAHIFVIYAVYDVVVSLVCVCINITYSYITSNGFDIGYGGNLCYISTFTGVVYTFALPVGLVILSNICFLVTVILQIRRRALVCPQSTLERNNIAIYLKMSTLTGFCWLFGYLRMLTKLDVFEFLFIITNCSQGLFLMLSFVCNHRVLGLVREFFQ